MKSKHAFIVHIPKKFKDTVRVGDTDLYIDPKFREFENRVCEGKIVSTPIVYGGGANVGDTLYFHHHVVMNEKLSLGDELYLVQYYKGEGYNTQAYAYKNENGINLIDEWVFLDAVNPEGFSSNSSGIILNLTKDDHGNKSKISFNSPVLAAFDLRVGDVVGFSKNSDYEMHIDGKAYWRMTINDIVYAERV
jgi:hypothetical protein